MILVIDNYDSFVHNIARYFEREGQECLIHRNDALSVSDIEAIEPAAIVISPGPCTPKEAGISVELIHKLGARIPILGVCLGHQCIGEAYGADIIRTEPIHGQASEITHDGHDLFSGLPRTIMAGRYHSLAISLKEATPLLVTARTKDGIIMAVKHNRHPVYGVQFHPESVLTERGDDMIRNFIKIVTAHKNRERLAA
ncbi:MAG: aminodeoxychorismate/anthranilate synthase component II [Alphaproteobacteria bacterium]